MKMRPAQYGLCLVLAACGTSPSASADTKSGTAPFEISEVTTFDSPWAMDFLPGSGVPRTNIAIVTEKAGRLWLVDVTSGQKRQVPGVPTVLAKGQGGLLDVVASPSFAGDGYVYLTFSEPSQRGGSQLALGRGRLVLGSAPALQQFQVLWRNPAGGEGGHFGARIAFAPDGNSLFMSAGERQRFTPAQDANQPLGKILHLTLDGKPMANNPGAGRTGASTVRVTDPPEDSIAAYDARARTVAWPRPNLTPAETWTLVIATHSGLPSPPTDDCGRPRWVRAAATRST